ncbi:MFS transporter [Pseudomonas gingeri]|nr:MFS transporter [Pseudomonas gingeri]NVZ73456.1 MFS transporter [Pseudomonas gingeri]
MTYNSNNSSFSSDPLLPPQDGSPDTVLPPSEPSRRLDPVYLRVTWRLMPVLLLAQVLAFLDRVNVGTAKLQMATDLQLSASAYGLGAGIFFLGYFLFEVPSNLLLHRLGARGWIARIMLTWGLVSAAAMFIQTPTAFYLQRFFLGVAEAGFFPGVILYLTYWFPAQRRGRMTTLFMTASALAGVISGPVSGWIMSVTDGTHGLAGWRWMFLVEGLPSVLVAGLVYWLLPSTPKQAAWLSSEEKALLLNDMATPDRQPHAHRFKELLNPITLMFSLIYFLLLMGLYGINFWLPTIIKGAGVNDTLTIGWLSAIPYLCAAVAMNLVARSADRTRRWGLHVGLAALVASAGFLVTVLSDQQMVLSLFGLTLASAGILSALPLFWNLPTQRLNGVAAAAGIAFINSVGNLSGFVGPSVMGWLIDRSQHTGTAIVFLSVTALLAGLLTLSHGANNRPARTPAFKPMS